MDAKLLEKRRRRLRAKTPLIGGWLRRRALSSPIKDGSTEATNAQVKRKLRSVAQRLKFTKKSILVTTPTSKLPEELKDEAVVVEFAPPNAAEIESADARGAQRDILRPPPQTKPPAAGFRYRSAGA
jgi:hypothetical protein